MLKEALLNVCPGLFALGLRAFGLADRLWLCPDPGELDNLFILLELPNGERCGEERSRSRSFVPQRDFCGITSKRRKSSGSVPNSGGFHFRYGRRFLYRLGGSSGPLVRLGMTSGGTSLDFSLVTSGRFGTAGGEHSARTVASKDAMSDVNKSALLLVITGGDDVGIGGACVVGGDGALRTNSGSGSTAPAGPRTNSSSSSSLLVSLSVMCSVSGCCMRLARMACSYDGGKSTFTSFFLSGNGGGWKQRQNDEYSAR